MSDWLHNLLMLAQEGAKEVPANGGEQAPPPMSNLLMWMLPFFIIFMIWQLMFNPRKKEEKRRSEMVQSLKKNDRIITIGGITGTVASVSEDHQFVTIKVEDNTRIKMLASSIQTVVRDETKEETAETPKVGG